MTTNPEATEREQGFTRDSALFEFASDPGVCVTECENGFRLVLVNDAACRYFGKKREVLLKLHISDIVPHVDLGTLQQTLHAKNHALFDSEHLSSSGKHQAVKGLAYPVIHENKEYIFVFFKNSADSKHLETEQLRLEAALRQSEESFRALVVNSPDPIFRYDRDGHRIYVNPAAERYSGKSADILLGKEAGNGTVVDTDDNTLLIDTLKEVLATGQTLDVEIDTVTADGILRTFHDHIAPEYGPGGEIVSAICIARDITAIKKQELLEEIRSSIFEHLVRGKELKELLDEITRFATTAIDDSNCSILLYDETMQNLTIAATSRPLPPKYMDFIEKFAVNRRIGICSCVAVKSEIGIVEDIEKEKACRHCRDMALRAGIRACWSVPVLAPLGKTLGIVTVYSGRPRQPTDQQLEQLRQIGYLTALVAEHKHYEQTIKKQASYDALTGLVNRRLFADRMHEEIVRAKRDGTHLGLLFIDLDHFKEVNDTLGHEYGDHLLVEAAQRIRGCVRESDVAARFGGDEFVVLIINVGSPGVLGRVARNIVNSVALPFQLDNHSAQVSVSIGISNYPDDSCEPEELINFADRAMYAAKKKGRNGYAFFCPHNKHESNITDGVNTPSE